MFKGLFPGDIVDEEGPDCASVVGSGNRPEILLASRVPDLQLYDLVGHLDIFSSEFNSDRHIMARPRLILDELQHNTGFPNA